MPPLRFVIPVLLWLACRSALAEEVWLVEMILFRHAESPVEASQPVPHDWRQAARPLLAGSERPPALNALAARLTPEAGYRVLLHKAWRQPLADEPARVAIEAGARQAGHAPLESRFVFTPSLPLETRVDVWVNRFDPDGRLLGSEHLGQRVRLRPGALHYLDHGSLGLLLRASRQ